MCPVPDWSRALYVCLCHGVTDSEIRDAAEAGCSAMPELMMRTGCGSSCGCCVETATGLLEGFQAVDADADCAEDTRPALPVVAAAA